MLRYFRSISRGRARRGFDDHGDDDAVGSPFEGSPEVSRNRVVGQEVDDDDLDDDEESYSPRRRSNAAPTYGYFDRPRHHNAHHDEEDEEDVDGDDDDDEDMDNEDAERTPLLPVFSAAHLDRLPLYNITHAIRLLIVQKCETTLSWEQLRSPQISQFLVKPIQSQIRTNHFNRATICALIANCLQFHKEGHMHPGNAGVSKTRAFISELLAMRLLREFSTHELIDALSYDFDPLQGMTVPAQNAPGGGISPSGSDSQTPRAASRGARVSSIEIAIRAEAKRFLAHPLVVQHLEAIWSGNIVFHSQADSLHRKARRRPADQRGRSGYGTTGHSPSALPADSILSRKAHAVRTNKKPAEQPAARRSVTLYDPREASLFKLSRLRVPRYRQVFSTISFATMLGLFVAVLYDRSINISALEILFWFWSAGYMLDEVVGFTEQGFGLYILSFWNAFDLGILCLFAIYYCLRLYGIVIAESGRHQIAGVAYDVLASTAILLFPRLFSVLDHYRYFSQLLIAFRMMAQDLMAILVLILISCSGFFVAFTLSFADENTDANAVAYSLFQILMGFTPAAWDNWNGYNILGKAIMAAFLIICHFLIVTILITVLTNSFMAIVKNAEEEHQFLFAINTISMVKSDALFSYVAPTNIIGWMLSPLRFIIPMRPFVRFNRTIIKATHFPILFIIFAYERMIMARSAFAPTDLVEQQPVSRSKPVAFSINKPPEIFSPNRLREPSVMSFNKDRALDEVFRRPFNGSTVRTTTRDMDGDRRNSSTAVDKWMQVAENEGGASPPMEQPRSVVDRLETRRMPFRRANSAADRLKMMRSREFSTATRSVASNPDRTSSIKRRPYRIGERSETPLRSTDTIIQETDADDEEDETDVNGPAVGESAVSVRKETRAPGDDSGSEEFFQTPTAGKSPMMQLSSAAKSRTHGHQHAISGTSPKLKRHQRNLSTGTMLFAPQIVENPSISPGTRAPKQPADKTHTGTATGTATPIPGQISNLHRAAKGKAAMPKARPIMPPRQSTAPGLPTIMGGLAFVDLPRRRDLRQPSFNARALDLASEIGDNKWGPSGGTDAGGISGMPASFSEQLMRERDLQRRAEEERRRSAEEEKGMVNRIMLARMHTLEEGFREVLREIKDMSHHNSSHRDSEVDFHPLSRDKSKLKLDTATSGSGSGTAPKTPIGRIAGNERKERKSPRKAHVKGGQKKEGQKSELAKEVEAPAADQESPQSVVGISISEVSQSAGGAAEPVRPDTAIRQEDLMEFDRGDEQK